MKFLGQFWTAILPNPLSINPTTTTLSSLISSSSTTGKTKEEQNKLQLLMVKPTTTVEWGKLVKEFNTSLIFHIHSKMIQGLMDLILSSLLMVFLNLWTSLRSITLIELHHDFDQLFLFFLLFFHL
ncbi:hypothetical protein Pst134EA_022670 [Puccinia striiformis f. sp. tritici]|uniref:hypothetical protein n=1 Tax=Puccinia striiformis f. sp. tritici TaxID=168172 RepID=UPI00200795CB|nr:hypothetical protein Pst134EA_022670 [Puccinia striiformis f. sp. tritici]KAH9455196.1 hypothetical protein Pst134EA_022670 [Puccinia striiformis f. sp. tritici]